MKTCKLGSAQVSTIGLGTMSFGGIFGPTDQAESAACLDAMLDAGITFMTPPTSTEWVFLRM